MSPKFNKILTKLKLKNHQHKIEKRSIRDVRSKLRFQQLEDRLVPAFVIRLEQEGFAPLTIVDEGPGDAASGFGNLQYVGVYGTFSLNATLANTKPILGGPISASLALSQFNIVSSTGGSLIITSGDTDYDAPSSANNPLTMKSVIGGNNAVGSSVSFQSWANIENLTPFDSAITTIPTGSISPGLIGPIYTSPFSAELTTSFSRSSGPYSLFHSAKIVMPNSGSSLSFNARTDVTGVPSPPVAALGDYVWEDLNANGQQDSGEPGIPGVTVTLLDSASNSTGITDVTDANGEYLFGNLTPGTYSVSFPSLPGYARTTANSGNDASDSDADGTTGKTGQYTLVAGETNRTVDAGYYKPVSIGDFVWNDLDADGIQDGNEPGIPSVTVNLKDSGGNVIDSMMTDSNGNYLFDDLAPGTYSVQFVKPTDYDGISEANEGTNDLVDSDGVLPNLMTATTTLTSGQSDLSLDQGFYKTVRVGDYVWYDENYNGFQDATEAGIDGVTLTLSGTDGSGNSVSASTTTAGGGQYLFDNLKPGTYQVAITNPSGYVPTVTGGGIIVGPILADENDSNTSPAITTPGFLPGGSEDLTLDFGFYKLSRLGDFVWEDRNANGQQDNGEPGIDGVEVILTGTNFKGEAVSQTTTTSGGGQYLFDNLYPGSYKVTFPPISGFVRTFANLGNDVTDSDADKTTGMTGNYILGSDQTNLTVDAGYYKPAALGDFVWVDTNGNGQQDTGEPGISGISVVLTGTDGTGASVNQTTTTNSLGKYLFDNLVPGTYSVTFPTITGYIRTVANTGPDVTDSDANATTGATGVYTLVSGQTDLTVDAGYIPAAPAIDIEKTTDGNPNFNPVDSDFDNEDSPSGLGVPVLSPGDVVTWTYRVTNTGNVPFLLSEVVVVDDNGTPSNMADDITPTLVTSSDVGSDGILSPGESWTYTATGTVLSLNTSTGAAATFDFSGSSSLSGSFGNIRTFTAGSGSTAVSVKASAFSRDSGGTWTTAYLGSFSGGLGVTDSSEGSGSNNTHTVDNIGRDNYVLFEFDQVIVPDAAYLGYVVNDSDLRIWIGTMTTPFSNHITLSDTVLTSLGFTELNSTISSSARWAEFNAGNVAGNVLVIAAATGESSPNDRFKIENLTVRKTETGIYANTGIVKLNGYPGITDSDLSHYKNPTDQARVQLKKYVAEVFSSGGEGLTPGFWKQSQHFYAWTGYTPGQNYNAVFGVNDDPALTLLGALQRGGGGNDALGRHAVAALLNAANENVAYSYTTTQIIALVQAAYASNDFESPKNLLASQNELGADLSDGGGDSVSGPLNDANSAPGLIVLTGSQVAFTYNVTNPGTVGLTNVVVRDDNATPGDTSDDFNATPVLSAGFNVGDTDKDNVLDVGETWQFVAGPITVLAGQFTNIGTVTATPVNASTPVSDTDPANWFGQTNDETAIRGVKYRDVSGNGLNLTETAISPADVPLPGVVVYLDENNNNSLDAGESWVTTAADGSFLFLNLTPGDYIVREVVPADYLRTFPILQNFHAVTLGAGQSVDGLYFANFEKCEPGTISHVSFKIYNPDGTFRAHVDNLRGNVNPGDRVKAFFTVNAGHDEVVTLVSYTAPESYFNSNTASQQTVFDIDSAEFGPGSYVLEVVVPNSNFQIDFVCGPAIEQLGPSGSNIFYTPQMRLISADNDGNGAPQAVSTLSGYVYVDANNNGIKESGEAGIAGVNVTLTGTDYLGNPVEVTTTTGSDGKYTFANVKMSDLNGYRISEEQPDNFLDGKDSVGSLGGLLHNDFIDEILLGANVDGVGYNFGERTNATSVGSLAGYVYVDVDDDGRRELYESGIIDVVVKLFKFDGSNWVSAGQTTTDEDGYYQFVDLAPGTYRITQDQPDGFLDGKEKAGSLGGSTSVNDQISSINLGSGQAGVNYNFGEVGVSLRSGMTATIGFWKNKNGQKIIENMGLTSDGLSLANWLAQNFPNLYGSLANKSNSYVADYFVDIFRNNDTKAEAQVMATVLSVFVTDTRLNTSRYGRSLAMKHGFRLSGTASTGNALFNVGYNGEAFQLQDHSRTTVWELLRRVDLKASSGKVYHIDLTQVINVFSRINELGDI